ncbi:hypothetical protein QBC43DRAFT_126327 [Cladorrhinum sp. PSN259]|nr:hypothetical protein QBC43DRAFT_126327 [Cladorrhinum sp. PSN259]
MDIHSISPGADPQPLPCPTYPSRSPIPSSQLSPTSALCCPECERDLTFRTPSPRAGLEHLHSPSDAHYTFEGVPIIHHCVSEAEKNSATPRLFFHAPDSGSSVGNVAEGISKVSLQSSQPAAHSHGGARRSTKTSSTTDDRHPTASSSGCGNTQPGPSPSGKANQYTKSHRIPGQEGDDQGGDDDDDEGRRNPSHHDREDKQPASKQMLECLYRQRNKDRFSSYTYRSCLQGFPSFSRLKNHIKIHHRRDPKTRSNDPEDGITESMFNRLNDRKHGLRINTVTKLWNFLFPDDGTHHIPPADCEGTSDGAEKADHISVVKTSNSAINEGWDHSKAQTAHKDICSHGQQNPIDQRYDVPPELAAAALRSLQTRRHAKNHRQVGAPANRPLRTLLPKPPPSENEQRISQPTGFDHHPATSHEIGGHDLDRSTSYYSGIPMGQYQTSGYLSAGSESAGSESAPFIGLEGTVPCTLPAVDSNTMHQYLVDPALDQ